SDILDPVVSKLLAGCGIAFSMTVTGGTDAAAEAALGLTQEVAPMGRPLCAATCSAHPNATQMVIGLDAVTDLASAANSCSGTAANNDLGAAPIWQSTLKLLYFGINGGTTDCNQAARRNLAANYALLFPNSCASGACDGKVIRHVFRPDD